MEIRSRYNAGIREGWKSSAPSMTQQQFKDEADINYIVSMYDSSGVMPTFHGDGQPAQPVFGDFASLPDNAQEMYNRMTNKTRHIIRFNNSFIIIKFT